MHNGKKIRTGSFWHPEIWTYSGKSWFGPADIQSDWGWWRRIPILTAKSGKLFAAIQEGIGISYQLANKSASRVVIEQLHPETPAVKARTRAFKMPETSFDLPAYIRKFSLRLPEQTVNLNKNKLNLYWGDLHEHTAMSQCARTRNPPSPDLFLNQHVIDGLNFTALTDHGYNHCDRSWAFTREQVRLHHDPDRFISLLGVEWTSETHGHHNLIFSGHECGNNL